MSQIKKSLFGSFTDPITNQIRDVVRYTIENRNFVKVQIINYGATIISIQCPDKDGKVNDVVLGFDSFEGYLTKTNPYFGAVVGRVANRIGNAKFNLNGKEIAITANRHPNHLHGGARGFDKVIWEDFLDGDKVIFTYLSKNGEEGYPEDLLVSATYSLTEENELKLEMKATATGPTPVNLTNHSYFNLAGHDSGSTGLYQHLISVNADRYTVTDGNSIPTGKLEAVGGTLWDLRIPKLLGDVLPLVPGGGYDQNLCITRGTKENITFVARVVHPETGRILEVYSNQPGVQLYTSNYFPLKPNANDLGQLRLADTDIVGRNGIKYYKHGAFCLETQNYPDAVNHDNFPNSILKPSQEYNHVVVYKFGTIN